VVARVLPLVRSFASLVAGFAQVPALRFGVLSAIGTVIYATIVASIGYGVGTAWHSVAHDLAIQDSSNNRLATSDLVSAGDSKEFDVNDIPAGTYKIFCTQQGHEASGMKGTLTVT